jgi:hypothetical protein
MSGFYVKGFVRKRVEKPCEKCGAVFIGAGQGKYCTECKKQLNRDTNRINRAKRRMDGKKMSDLAKQWKEDCEKLSNPLEMWEWQYKDRAHLNEWFKCDKPVRLTNPLVNYRRLETTGVKND